MNDDEVLCEIKWTVADVKKAFRDEYNREPTQEESITMSAIQGIYHKMTELELRDLFAMSAMNSLVQTQWGSEVTEDCIARFAYKQADAMVKARSKK